MMTTVHSNKLFDEPAFNGGFDEIETLEMLLRVDGPDDTVNWPAVVRQMLNTLAPVSDDPELRAHMKRISGMANDSLSAVMVVLLQLDRHYTEGIFRMSEAYGQMYVLERVAICLLKWKAPVPFRHLIFGRYDEMMDSLEGKDLLLDSKSTYTVVEQRQDFEAPTPVLLPSVTEAEIARRFDEGSSGPRLLEGLLGQHGAFTLVAAGGSVLNAATKTQRRDVDVFITLTDAEAGRPFQGFRNKGKLEAMASSLIAEKIKGLMTRHFKEYKHIWVQKTTGVVTVHLERYQDGPQAGKSDTVQFIKRIYVDPMQIPLSFDFDLCKWLYDGTRVLCTRSAVYTTLSGAAVVDPLKNTYAKRFLKYTDYGWKMVAPLYAGLPYLLMRIECALQQWTALELRKLCGTCSLAGVITMGKMRRRRYDACSQVGASTFDAVIEEGLPFRNAVQTIDFDSLEILNLPRSQKMFDMLAEDDWEVSDPCKRMHQTNGDFLQWPAL